MTKFVPTKEYSPDDVTIVNKLRNKRIYDKKRVNIRLSETAWRCFMRVNKVEDFDEVKNRRYLREPNNMRWSKYFTDPTKFNDERDHTEHRMFAAEEKEDLDARFVHSMMHLSDDVEQCLDALFVIFELDAEPHIKRKGNLSYGRLASVILEALALGVITLDTPAGKALQ